MPACALRRCGSSASIAWIPPACWWRATARSKQRGHGRPPEDFPVAEETLFPSGSAALYRRAMLEEIGGFDDSFFLYCEDTDLGLRARWAGWKCLYVPEAVVEHHYSHSAGGASPLKAYYVERNRLFVLAKNFPARMLLAAPFVTLARYLWHALVPARGPRQRRPFPRGRHMPGRKCSGTCCARTPRCCAHAPRLVARAARDPRAARASRRRSSAIWCAATPSAPGGWPRCDPRRRARFPAGDRAGVQRRRRHRRRGARGPRSTCPASPVLVIDDCSADGTIAAARAGRRRSAAPAASPGPGRLRAGRLQAGLRAGLPIRDPRGWRRPARRARHSAHPRAAEKLGLRDGDRLALRGRERVAHRRACGGWASASSAWCCAPFWASRCTTPLPVSWA